MSLAIEIKSLYKSFGSTEALKDINLEVEEGSIFGFLGANGAGKTTTIKILMGLMKADSGSAKILGMDCFKDSVKINERVAYVPEDDQLYGYMKISEIINFTKGFYKNWNQSLLEKYLDFFNLPLEERIKKLSKVIERNLEEIFIDKVKGDQND